MDVNGVRHCVSRGHGHEPGFLACGRAPSVRSSGQRALFTTVSTDIKEK